MEYDEKEENSLLADIIIKMRIDYSNYYTNWQLSDKNFVVKILKDGGFSNVHDSKLISKLKDFFYNDSNELRKIIVENPVVYDKLAKCGNKPNFTDEYLKKIISILGSKYFVSRLNHNLANDKEFMRQIILENPENLFRGSMINYKDEIRKNAFNLFGDNSKNLFNIYGMEYLIGKSDDKFFDYCEYLKYNVSPKYLEKIKNKILSSEEEKQLTLRGVFSQEYYRFKHFDRELNNFRDYLKFNFDYLKIGYNERLIEELCYSYEKFCCNDYRGNMALANNIVIAYQRGLLKEFEEIAAADKYNANLIDMNTFDREVIELLGIKTIAQFCYYPNSLYILSQIKKDGDLLLYKELLDKVDNDKLAPAIIPNILLYTVYSYKEAILSLKGKNSLTKENVLLLINITENNKLLDIKNDQDVINYPNNLSKFCDEEIESCQNVNYAKEILFAKLLKGTRKQAQKFILTYKEGMKLKKDNNYLYLELLEIIDSLSDVSAIKKAYKTLKNMQYFSKSSFEGFEMEAKRSIVGENYVKEDLNNYERGKFYGVDIVSPKVDKEFNILIHVLGAFGNNPEANSIMESWNTTSKDNVSGICATLISNKTVQKAPESDDSIIFGFTNNLDSQNINMCAPYDIWSKNNLLEPVSNRPSKFVDADNMPDYQRGAFGKYNEIVISRYLDEKKRQPDYVVVFDYDSKEKVQKSAEVAKNFGIPVVCIRAKEIFNYNFGKLQELYNDYLKVPTLDKAKELYTMYFTLKNGFYGIPNINTDRVFNAESIKEFEKQVISRLSEEDKKAFESFIEKESLKEKIIDYEEDQKNIVNEKKNNLSGSIYNQMRREYGLFEGLKLRMMSSRLQKFIGDNENIIMEESRGKSK